jgi:tRNA pseudouridine55 synthase
MKAVGHAGTLDPMADGLLIMLLGEATKFSNYIMGQDKKYSAEIQLGLTTDSWDAEGQLETTPDEFNQKKIDLNQEELLAAVLNLQGPLSLKVPVHSAVKINGKKLYDYARKGQDIETPTRVMNFYKSELKSSKQNNYYIGGNDFKTLSLQVDLDCEKGSYIRSWVHHLGQNLGCGALMSGLTRHQSGKFKLEDAVSYSDLIDIDQLKSDPEKLEPAFKKLQSKVIDLKECFEGPFFRAFENEIRLLKNGQVPNDLNVRIRPVLKKCQQTDTTELIRIFNSDLSQMVAILELAPIGRPKIIRVFQ